MGITSCTKEEATMSKNIIESDGKPIKEVSGKKAYKMMRKGLIYRCNKCSTKKLNIYHSSKEGKLQ